MTRMPLAEREGSCHKSLHGKGSQYVRRARHSSAGRLGKIVTVRYSSDDTRVKSLRDTEGVRAALDNKSFQESSREKIFL